MIKEKSCGAVVFRITDNEILYLIIKMGLGHLSMPKGHVEKGESEIETAQREILEETNLMPMIDINFRKVITYSPKANAIKDVVFFVAEDSNNFEPCDKHDDEVVDFMWLDYEKAYEILTYKDDKDVLEEANKYVRNKYGKL